jgi:hypothetical protein
LVLDNVTTVDQVIQAYEEQMEAIEKLGGKLIVMASRALARVAKSPADYERVYDRILSQAKQPVVLHWLGDMFDPALKGYWGSNDVDQAMATTLGIINAHPSKVDGIKISLLDKDKEIAMRRRLPTTGGLDGQGVRMYTGDDFNYAELIAGDGHGKSDALLVFLMPSPPQPAPPWASWRWATSRNSTPSWAPPCRCRATSLPRPPASTKLVWCSWPG